MQHLATQDNAVCCIKNPFNLLKYAISTSLIICLSVNYPPPRTTFAFPCGGLKIKAKNAAKVRKQYDMAKKK